MEVPYPHIKWFFLHIELTFIPIATLFINNIVIFKEVINQWSW